MDLHHLLLQGKLLARPEWCPEGESDPHAFRPLDFKSRSSAIPTPGLWFANQKPNTLTFASALSYRFLPALDGAPRGSRTPTPFGPWILSPGRLPFRHRGLDIAHYGWCPGRESHPHAFRPVDFESRSSAIPTPGLRFANQDDFAFHSIARAFHIVPTLYTTE